ncbi:MAG: hypothetical protein ACREBC_33595, partial [Pyrinomonadaceae bacterium]
SAGLGLVVFAELLTDRMRHVTCRCGESSSGVVPHSGVRVEKLFNFLHFLMSVDIACLKL